jgi:Ser/Thr protein kinase RdoA (MazF antagonist)
MKIENYLKLYGYEPKTCNIKNFGNGLINNTWKITDNSTGKSYIFQRINDAIFKHPEDIAFNIRSIDQYLKQNYSDYLFIGPLPTLDGRDLIRSEEGYFRLFDFVPDSHSIDIVSSTEQAYEAAHQFGLFTSNLHGFNASELRITLPDFHNLPLRFHQFQEAINIGNKERIKKAASEIKFLTENQFIADISNDLSKLPIHVIHHDTKISNVLFDDNDKGLCVIDLDTVMPGKFVSDLGDMMRTYLSPANEEEADFDKIEVRIDYFEAILKGYLNRMKNILTPDEKKYIVYSGQYMIYMQALRFMTDYFNDDAYYGSRYEGHNFIRGCNQIALLKKYNEKKDEMEQIAKSYS